MKLKKITLLGVLAVLCLNFSTKAQRNFDKTITNSVNTVTNSPEITSGTKDAAPLRVGDKLPEAFWKQEHTIYADGKTSKQTLEAYKDKLLILDFWATWCSPCISAFPKLQTYQQQFKNKLAIVLVNSVNTADKDERINKVLAKFSNSTEALACIKSDTVLLKSFPHAMVPLYVWIIDSSVRAITAKEWLSEINITEVLQASNKLNSSSTKQAQQ
ncbi:MAG: thioredoxin domain-containing protein [Pedobacter sp.]|uniref:TlpA family protein disulfide reductase n=1 Tax=Pedobacter sp. TaxID=1411316 RepID=UPI00280939F7|nr:redoxin family protein [Pedobacter sp.]MDQ8005262.1 thioredoxin domain-containing protein [Pedobacter sp.]